MTCTSTIGRLEGLHGMNPRKGGLSTRSAFFTGLPVFAFLLGYVVRGNQTQSERAGPHRTEAHHDSDTLEPFVGSPKTDEQAGLRLAVANLQSRMERLERRPVEPLRNGTTSDERSSPSPSERALALDLALHREAQDPTWVAKFREIETRALSTEGLQGVSILETQCGSSLCRMDVALPETVNPGRLLVALSDQGLHGGIWYTTDESVTARGHAMFYEARAGSHLPESGLDKNR